MSAPSIPAQTPFPGVAPDPVLGSPGDRAGGVPASTMFVRVAVAGGVPARTIFVRVGVRRLAMVVVVTTGVVVVPPAGVRVGVAVSFTVVVVGVACRRARRRCDRRG